MRGLRALGTGVLALLVALPSVAQEKASFTVDVEGIYGRLQTSFGPPFAPLADLDGDGFPDSQQANVLEFLEVAADVNDPEHEVVHDGWIDNFLLARNAMRTATSLANPVIDDIAQIIAMFMFIDGPGMEVWVEDFWEDTLGITDPEFESLPWVHDHGHDDDDHHHDDEHEHAQPISGGGIFQVGDELLLTIPDPVDEGGVFQWYRNGIALTDLGGIRLGTNTRTLEIYYLEVEDSGEYTATYDDGTKAPATFGPVSVSVIAPGLPVSGLLGLGAVALLLGSGGAIAIRRMKK